MIKEKILGFVFPKICGHCGNKFKAGLSNVLCQECFDSISPYEDPTCGHCGVSLPPRAFEDAVRFRCRDCGEGEYALDLVRALGPYEGPLRIAHHAFKFEGMENLKCELAEKMVGVIPAFFWRDVGALVAVPLSPERERERGYNPAFLLAIEISKLIHIPVVPSIRKIRSTTPQMSLTREERLHNPKDAYRVETRQALPAKVILVDDVFTTGATLEECAKILKKSEVLWVGALVFGRTPHNLTTIMNFE